MIVEQPRLKLYVDPSYCSAKQMLIPLLLPFFGHPKIHIDNPDFGLYDSWMTEGALWFELTSLKNCDIVVCPAYWEVGKNNESIFELSRKASVLGKRVLIFFWDDSEVPIDVPNAIIFRTSMLRKKRRPNEFTMPSWHKDYLTEQTEDWQPRTWTIQPTVGYCGYVAKRKNSLTDIAHKWGSNPQIDRVFSTMGIRLIKSYGVRLRTQSVRALKSDSCVKTDFVLRTDNNNGVFKNGFWNRQLASESRKVFYENILNNDYTLCTRGVGNFSCRFYQTLLCGRIPFQINTDCVLPFEDHIKWDRHIVQIEESDMSNLSQRLLSAHSMFTMETFIEQQKQNRKLWEEWLSPTGFHKNIYRIILSS